MSSAEPPLFACASVRRPPPAVRRWYSPNPNSLAKKVDLHYLPGQQN